MRSKSHMTTKIAITNQKGGVGKTTVTKDLAGALAARDNRVLLVDSDPQGYLTSALGLDDSYTAQPPSLYDAYKQPREHDVDDLVVAHEEFDVLPANIDMFNLEQELVSGMQSRRRLNTLLEDLEGYDVVLVDCPPSLGILTDNALLACQNLVIPVEAEDTSIRALDLLFKQIDSLEQNFDIDIQERAIVVSNVGYPLDGEQTAMLDWFDENFGTYIPIFEVRTRAAIKRAANAGVSVLAHEEDCDQEDELLRIAEHVEELDPEESRD